MHDLLILQSLGYGGSKASTWTPPHSGSRAAPGQPQSSHHRPVPTTTCVRPTTATPSGSFLWIYARIIKSIIMHNVKSISMSTRACRKRRLAGYSTKKSGCVEISPCAFWGRSSARTATPNRFTRRGWGRRCATFIDHGTSRNTRSSWALPTKSWWSKQSRTEWRSDLLYLH